MVDEVQIFTGVCYCLIPVLGLLTCLDKSVDIAIKTKQPVTLKQQSKIVLAIAATPLVGFSMLLTLSVLLKATTSPAPVVAEATGPKGWNAENDVANPEARTAPYSTGFSELNTQVPNRPAPEPVAVAPEPKPTITIGEADAVHFYLDAPNEQTIGESTFDGTTVTWSSEIKNGRYSNTFYRYKCNVKTGELGIKWRHLNMNKTGYERCEVQMSNGVPASARMVAEDGYVSQDIRFTF